MSARIPLVDLSARHMVNADAIEARVLGVLRSGRWVGGPSVVAVERAAATLFARAGAVAVNSGTDALMLGLQALGVQSGEEVAVPALTFFATAGAVCGIGAIPRIVDVDARGLMDPESLELVRTERLRAVIPVHLFGNRCTTQLDGIPTLDDAAQAAGAAPPASTGVLTAVSTYATKLWSGPGDGGFVVGDDPHLLERVRRLANHGSVGPHLHEAVHTHVGRNSRMDAISAAALLGQLPTLPDGIRRRQRIAAHYDGCMPADTDPLPRDRGNPVPVYMLRSPRRDAIAAHLDALGIDSTVYYPRPLHHQPALHGRIPATEAPVAEQLCQELLAIPVHEGLDDGAVERVGEALITA